MPFLFWNSAFRQICLSFSLLPFTKSWHSDLLNVFCTNLDYVCFTLKILHGNNISDMLCVNLSSVMYKITFVWSFFLKCNISSIVRHYLEDKIYAVVESWKHFFLMIMDASSFFCSFVLTKDKIFLETTLFPKWKSLSCIT